MPRFLASPYTSPLQRYKWGMNDNSARRMWLIMALIHDRSVISRHWHIIALIDRNIGILWLQPSTPWYFMTQRYPYTGPMTIYRLIKVTYNLHMADILLKRRSANLNKQIHNVTTYQKTDMPLQCHTSNWCLLKYHIVSYTKSKYRCWPFSSFVSGTDFELLDKQGTKLEQGVLPTYSDAGISWHWSNDP